MQVFELALRQVSLLELPGLELGGPFGNELGGGASGERSLALLIVKLKLRGGGGIRAAPLHQLPVVFRCRKHIAQRKFKFQRYFFKSLREGEGLPRVVRMMFCFKIKIMASEGWVPSF